MTTPGWRSRESRKRADRLSLARLSREQHERAIARRKERKQYREFEQAVLVTLALRAYVREPRFEPYPEPSNPTTIPERIPA